MALMRGATSVRRQIANFLQTNMPELIEAAREEWTLEDWQLPLPLMYNSYDPLTASAFPNIGSFVRQTNNWNRRDILDGAEHYTANYNVVVFMWARTPEMEDGTREGLDYDETLRLRDDLLGLLRTCLLTTPSLGSDGLIEMNESTLQEDYLDAIRPSGEAPHWLAGGTLAFTLKVAEQNRHIPLGTADDINVEVQKMI